MPTSILIVDAMHIDATDLPGYAGRLFTYSVQHPELVRLVTWARLEGRLVPAPNVSRRDRTLVGSRQSKPLS